MLRAAFAVLGIVLLVVTVLGQERTPEAHLTVNGISSGTSRAAIIRNIGKPRRELPDGIDECGENGKMRTLSYPGLTIGVLGDARGRNYKVWKIQITSGSWKIHPGLSVGATRRKVRSVFGPGIKEKHDPSQLLYVTRENMGLVSFHFKAGRLVRVEMQEVLC